jgi:ABC-2 type transport system permease protein
MTTVAVPAPTALERPVTRTTSIVTGTAQVARRALLRFFRTPQLIAMGTVQMALFLFIYRYVLGGAVNPAVMHGVPYVDFLVPGFVATGVLFSGIGAATGVAEDLQQGFIDRLRSLPVPRASFLTGRAVADTLTATWGLIVAAAVGFGVGFRAHAPVYDDLAAFGLCIAFAFAFEWMFIAIGLVGGTPQGATGMAMVVFPLAFLSSSYVPVSTMPGWLQAFAQHQPVTYMVDAVRALTLGPGAQAVLGHPAGYFVGWSLVWAAGAVAVFAPLAVAKYQHS